ncbi:MAG TPA: penicillin-binding protein 2, partial [Candidatus Atribacteria bacterium]|nr:penicillin-binding protein 2 [Candidatus Atribacteria bacterium]
AKDSKIKELPFAGKTGTAQNPHGKPHSWFAGFAPYEDPQISFIILIENGGEGSEKAAPIARKIILKYFNIREENEEKN